jgi:hypothetical protein
MASNPHAEHQEGPEAAQRFEGTLRRVLTVSKEELTKREAAYKKSRRAKKTRQSRNRPR